MTKRSSINGMSNFGLMERIPDETELEAEVDEEDEEEDGVLFYVNKTGFPINNYTWDRMYTHVAKIHPDSYKMVHKIRNNNNLPSIPFPQAPVNFPMNTGIPERLELVQRYMKQLQYNHTGTQFFEIRKNRPISGLMDAAKEMIKESLPIKCLEAVILSLYLTIGIPGLDRFPISFKTKFNGNYHRHVVLGVYCLGKYGALGMSRRDDLMYKPLKYKTLSDLIKDYKTSYEKYWHEVKKVKIGLTVDHNPHSFEHIHWKQLSLTVPKMTSENMSKELDKFAREMRVQNRPISTDSSPRPVRKSSFVLPKRPSTDPKSPNKTRETVKSQSHASSKSTEQSPSRSMSKSMSTSTGDPDHPSTSPRKSTVDQKLDMGQYQIRI